MSMMYPIATTKRGKHYYTIRSIVRWVFWGAVVFGVMYAYGRYYA